MKQLIRMYIQNPQQLSIFQRKVELRLAWLPALIALPTVASGLYFPPAAHPSESSLLRLQMLANHLHFTPFHSYQYSKYRVFLVLDYMDYPFFLVLDYMNYP
jgi:hypothetical protein